ncbi:MAG: hypothetical protein ACYDEB_03745 [Dehalococcoidia bacterium]
MKRLLVSMDEERYEDLRRLAFEKKAPMADLVRYALEKVFEDDLDVMCVKRGIENRLVNPDDYIPWEAAKKELGIELPPRRSSRSRTRAQKAAS